jgi:hypothetical protein
LLNDTLTIFDALEFNENLRWIDVQSELAFLAMDLEYRGLEGLAWLLLSVYLESSGDYAGLRVFRHYKVYRAMVRAKVAALRAGQCEAGTAEARDCHAELMSHLRLAQANLAERARTPLIITHGLSGSGKSRLAQRLMQVVGAVCVRSDVERQRLVREGIIRADTRYTCDDIDKTYRALAGRARAIVECGYPAIVDATFLKHHHRLHFLELARELGAAFVIVSLEAPEALLEARVVQRQASKSDASEATLEVLRQQRESMHALDAEEQKVAITVSSEDDADVTALTRRILRTPAAPHQRRLAPSIRDAH